MPTATTPSLFRTTGLSIFYHPCISTLATNRVGGSGNLTELVSNYQHETAANNGFDNCTITIRGTWSRVQEWWMEGLGRDIQSFDPDLNLIWRGFVNSLKVSIGPLSASRGPLTDIANYAYTVYARILDNTVSPPVVGNATLTTAVTDANSVAQYGQWQKVLSGGTCLPSKAEYYRDTYLTEMRYPLSSEELNLGGSTQVQLTLSCLGYWHWLKAYVYSDANTGTRTIPTKLQDVLSADPNNIFSADYSYIEPNAFLATREENDSPYASTVIQSEVAVGDINNLRYTFGIWEDQVAHYQEVSNRATLYEHYLADDKIRVAGYGGGAEVDYWNVRANEWLFIADFLEGQAPDTVIRREDDRFLFIERCRYSIPDGLSINGMKISTLPQFLAKQGLGGTS